MSQGPGTQPRREALEAVCGQSNTDTSPNPPSLSLAPREARDLVLWERKSRLMEVIWVPQTWMRANSAELLG